MLVSKTFKSMEKLLANLELTTGTGHADRSLVTDNLSSDHGQSLALSGVNLSGHDAAAWFVLRQAQLTQTTSRSRTKVADIIGDLHEGASNHVQSAMRLHEGIVSGEGLELIRSSLEFDTSDLGDFSSDLYIEAFLGVKALKPS